VEKEIIEQLKQELGGNSITETTSRSRRTLLNIPHTYLKQAVTFFKENGFSQLTTITGSQISEDTLELLYHLDKSGDLVTLRVTLPPKQESIPTITDIIVGASLYEREIHDLLGVVFEGHPGLSRLVLPDEWQNDSHPLRTSKHT